MKKLAIAAGLLASAIACTNSATSEPEQRYDFKDAKGRQCSHGKFGLQASCDAVPAPGQACVPGYRPCFIVYGGFREERIGSPEVVPVWNCDACCEDGSSKWTATSTDCSAFSCSDDAACVSEEAVCERSQCWRTH